MKRTLKLCLTLFAIAGLGGTAGIAGDRAKLQATPDKTVVQYDVLSAYPGRLADLLPNRNYSVRAPQHGTHLCSDDDHCGTGHKCCSGHCKAVATC